MAPDNNSSEFTLQPDGSYGYHQVQPDGTTIYYQQLPDGAYGYFKPEADGTQSYFRQQADGSFVQWTRNADGTYAPPADAAGSPVTAPVVEAQPTDSTPVVEEVVVDAEVVGEAAAIPPAPQGAPVPPAPGADVAPVPPAAPAPSAVVAYAAPEAAAPGAKKSKKGLIIGAVAAGAVVILGAGALGVTTLLKGGGSSTTFVKDFAKEPTEAWNYDYSLGADSEYLYDVDLTPVGDDYVLVVPSFDYDAFYSDQDTGDTWGYETVWSEDYESQYDQGWDAYQQYSAAEEEYNAVWDEYWDNWDWEADYPDIDYPDIEDYWPGSTDMYDVDESLEGGIQDGFLDGYYEEAYGAHKLSKPVEPDFEATAALVDLRDGSEVWSKPLAEFVGEDGEYGSGQGIHDTTTLVIRAYNEDGDSFAVVVDGLTGEEITTFEPSGWISSVDTRDGWLYVAEADDDDTTTVSAYEPGDYKGKPVWEHETDGYAYLVAYSNYLLVDGDDAEALDLKTGELTPFSRALDEDTGVFEVGGTLVRSEYDSDHDRYELSAIDKNGKDLWSKPVTAETFKISGDALMVADSNDDYTFTKVMRINLKDGSDMWKSAIKGDFSSASGDHGGVFYLFGDKRIYQVNLSNGETKQDTKITAWSGYLSSSALYVVDDDEFVALNKKDLSERWSLKLDDGQWPTVMGAHLLLQDDENLELIGLK